MHTSNAFDKIPRSLQTAGVMVRPMEANDLEGLSAIATDPDMWAYFTSDLSKDMEAWIATALAQTKSGIRLAFTVLTADGKLAGSTSFGNYSERDSRVEIGWTWLGEGFQGKGLNRQVKFLLIQQAFETLDCERVEFKTDVLNLAARGGLEKAGGTLEGVLRSHTLLANGRRRDSVFYSILRSEWEQVKQDRFADLI